MLDKITTNISRIPTFYFLLLILCIGFILRTAAWFYFGTNLMEYRADGSFYQNEYEFLASRIIQGNWEEYFSHGRFYQPVYGLLLTPRYLFNLPQESYIFWLHHFLSLGTIYIIYLIGKRIFGVYFGLMSAFLISINVMIIFWFPWVYSDTAFHFFIALFALMATNLYKSQKSANYALFFFSGSLCTLTRPEGIFIFITAIILLIFNHLIQRFSFRKASVIIIGMIFFLSTLILTTLAYHKKTQETFLSQFHVSLAIYVSSKISTNSPEEQDQLYGVTIHKDLKNARAKPDYFNDNYSLSMIGLKFIKENPLTWASMYASRFTANLFPSIYSPNWSLGHRIYNFSMAFMLIIGGIMATLFSDLRRFFATTLVIMAFTLALSMTLFQREIDYRVPLSIFILFSMTAPYGWFKFYEYLFHKQ
jgi:4-amino-4-deoxy-L-arabinose transferase-like glycosyltransferase